MRKLAELQAADPMRQQERDHRCWSEVFVSAVAFPDLSIRDIELQIIL